jgi:hypothetical protein
VAYGFSEELRSLDTAASAAGGARLPAGGPRRLGLLVGDGGCPAGGQLGPGPCWPGELVRLVEALERAHAARGELGRAAELAQAGEGRARRLEGRLHANVAPGDSRAHAPHGPGWT